MRKTAAFAVLLLSTVAFARDKRKPAFSTLEQYLASVQAVRLEPSHAAGSLWGAGATFSDLSSDATAHHVDDLVTIRIVEETLAESTSDVSAQRKFNAQSGINALAGQVNTAGISSLFSPQSSQDLTGKGQANSQTRLRTSVAGRIAAVLPNGTMVVEAERSVRMNNETQTILLRGMLRPSDVLADNTALSTSLANLQIELKGKGVVSDATRPPNRIVRTLLWFLGF